MPIKNRPADSDAALKHKISREEHSAILRQYQREKGKAKAAHGQDWKAQEMKPAPLPAEAAETVLLAEKKEAAPPAHAYMVLDESRSHVTVQQELQYSRKREAMVSARIRLTTAVRGRRSQAGCSQAGYVLRLEVLSLTPGARVEGFTLGLWHVQNLALEAGSVVCPDIIWAGFQPTSALLQGRFLIADDLKHRLLDLPWKTQGIIPGIEPFPA